VESPGLVRKFIGPVAKNVFEGKKGEYLWVAQTRIVNFIGVF